MVSRCRAAAVRARPISSFPAWPGAGPPHFLVATGIPANAVLLTWLIYSRLGQILKGISNYVMFDKKKALIGEFLA